MESSPGLASRDYPASPHATGNAAPLTGSSAGKRMQDGEKAKELDDESLKVVDWPTMTWVIVLHLGCLAAPFFFSWQALVLTVVLHWMTGGIGICLGFHRYFTHGSFRTNRVVHWILGGLGGLAGEGSAIDWVANHRKHHAHSDQEGDPHSPLDGAMWSHMLWLTRRYEPEAHRQHIQRWAPDMDRDESLKFFHKMFLVSHFVLGGILYAAGYALGGNYMAMSFLIWGMFVRLCFVLHATWFVNSASHMWGYRNYVTTDESRNNWWVALITYGEGWHNNHHAYPRMAAHGHRWWEFDMTFAAIRLLRACGLAWDVVDYKRGTEKREKSTTTPTPPAPHVASEAASETVASTRA